LTMNGRFLFRKRKRKWGFNLAWYHHAFQSRKAAPCCIPAAVRHIPP